MDYSVFRKRPAVPEASSMIETFRAIGYSTEAAIADIIDNSISAGSKNVWLDFEWAGGETIISIRDDGDGMTDEEIIRAMRPGSKNPLAERGLKDLGRFGLGLKTASFSQCRKLTVVSKAKGHEPSWWTWDLDFIESSDNGWELIDFLPDESFRIQLGGMSSGTTVIWSDIDRMVRNQVKENETARDQFLAKIGIVECHLSMVFHRFIEQGSVKIFIRDRKIKAWNPFFENHNGVQTFPAQPFEDHLRIKGYVLPHRNKLTPDEYEEGKGPKDSWTFQQGFYVYRANRMLVSGDWLGMFKKEHHYDLCRIAIDISNQHDADWQIDIKKSQARPPGFLKGLIFSYAKDVRGAAAEVYRHRGKIIKRTISSEIFRPMWFEKLKNGKRFYEINREHPLIQNLLNGLPTGEKSNVSKVLKYIEQTIPVDLISFKASDREVTEIAPFESETQELFEDMKRLTDALTSKGNTRKQAIQALYFIEPYDHYPELIAKLSEL